MTFEIVDWTVGWDYGSYTHDSYETGCGPDVASRNAFERRPGQFGVGRRPGVSIREDVTRDIEGGRMGAG